MKAPVLLRIDDPEDWVIRTPVCTIRGWCASYDWAAVENIRFQICDGLLPWRPGQRPDVNEAHSDKATLGFCIDFDLSEHLYAVKGGALTITALPKGRPEIRLRFALASGVIGDWLVAAAGV